MVMHFEFPDGVTFKPRLLINAKGNTYEVTKRRWLQFLALLAYHRLVKSEDGFVSLEEIARLSSFHNLEHRAIGKYLSNTSVEFPPTMNYFINSCLDINTTGPYILALDSRRIETDINKLENYINWVYKKPASRNGDADVVWKVANRSLQRYELATSRQLFEAFIQAHKEDRDTPAEQIALAYINLANIMRLASSSSQVSKRLLAKARGASSGGASPH